MAKIIAFTSVRRSPDILKILLNNLSEIDTKGFEIEFWFYDDNDDLESSRVLNEYINGEPSKNKLLPKLDEEIEEFIQNEDTHFWNSALVDRIIRIKNYAIREFLKTNSDAIYFFDSDIIVHPKMLAHLLELKHEIICEIFWTKFSKKEEYKPNVWDIQTCTYRSADSIIRLRYPGVYKVGGGGACLLIWREPLEKGLNYSRIDNVDFWGEDRHFSVRAECLGYNLFVDTLYPAFHIYRPSLVPDCLSWIEQGYPRSYFDQWLNDAWEQTVRGRFFSKGLTLKDRLRMAVKILLKP